MQDEQVFYNETRQRYIGKVVNNAAELLSQQKQPNKLLMLRIDC